MAIHNQGAPCIIRIDQAEKKTNLRPQQDAQAVPKPGPSVGTLGVANPLDKIGKKIMRQRRLLGRSREIWSCEHVLVGNLCPQKSTGNRLKLGSGGVAMFGPEPQISAELWKHAIARFECPGDKTQIHTLDLDICFHLRSLKAFAS